LVLAGFSPQVSPSVEIGCPGEPALYEDEDDGNYSRLVERPSYYHAFVYVIPAKDTSRLFGSSRWRLETAEHVCYGDACEEVTTAAYLSRDDLADEDFVSRALRMTLGLVGPDDPEVSDYNFN
jgi:hypothetical protein